jgi:endo-1,4-beta-xylanase
MRKALAAASTILLGLTGVVVLATPAAADPLRVHAQARGIYFGDAVDNNEITDSTYRPLIGREFNALTPGNAMKWDATEPNQGQFNYSRGDAIVDLAESNDQLVRGHTLVWHNQTPGWVQNLSGTALRSALQNHITNVVTHYKGRLYAWDVVNEVLNEDGTMRNSFWYQKLGTSYIADAFRAARATDPDVKLYINDYNTDGLGAKSDGM